MLKNNTFGVDIKGNNNNLVFKNNTFGVDNKGKITINWCLKITLGVKFRERNNNKLE